jgi:HEAT repeat protein
MADSVANPQILRLVEALTAPDTEARIEAASALGQFGAENEDTTGLIEMGVPALSAALLADSVREVRWAAAYALGALADASAIPALWEAYRAAARDPGLRLIIVKALGKIGHPSTIPPLMAEMQGAESRCIRAAAAKALSRIGPDQPIKAR